MADLTTTFPVTEKAHHLAVVFAAVTSALLFVALATFAIRITVNLRRKTFGPDDWCIAFGVLFAIAQWVLLVVALAPYIKWSPHYLDVPAKSISDELSVISIPILGASTAFIKISIALTFLKLYRAIVWKKLMAIQIFLYGMIVLQAAMGATNIIFILTQCHPIQASWNPFMEGAKCLGPQAVRVMSTLSSVVSILTDIILSLIPISFVKQLDRPLPEKILICVLMGIGLLASAASIRKTLLVQLWTNDPDYAGTGFAILTWTCVEVFLGIIAACLPLMKPLFARALDRLSANFGSSKTFRSLDKISVSPPEKDVVLDSLRNDSTKSETESEIRFASVNNAV